MRVPDIRISRSEGSVAIRWPGDEAWYRVDHAVVSDDTELRSVVTSDRFRVGPRAWDVGPQDDDWFDPLAGIDQR